MYHPYQRLASVKRGNYTFLLAAAGPQLICVNLEDGTIASKWSTGSQESISDANNSVDSSTAVSRPVKRRKVEPSEASDEVSIIEIVSTPNGQHIVVATAEDKCLRVFAIDSEGLLQLLSTRCMPKRPSALTLMNDGATIICADKFGDVYALPLLPTEEQDNAAKEAARRNAKSLRVMATETTVHSKANLKSLDFQRKQAGTNLPAKTKDIIEFGHDLLLGHVSMVTDVVAAEYPTDYNDEVLRTHIISSDRDEHIRISRGPPQSFVIEKYCLGHKEYISKMCCVQQAILVSGGGDDDLFVWNLRRGHLLSRVPLLSALARASGLAQETLSIAVSGLYYHPVSRTGEPFLLIGVEGQPYLFYCPVSNIASGPTVEFVPLDGNLLSLAFARGQVIVSLDNIHATGSMKDIRTDEDRLSRLQVISIPPAEKTDHHVLQARLKEANEIITAEWREKRLRDLLYSIGSLRKLRNDLNTDGPIAVDIA